MTAEDLDTFWRTIWGEARGETRTGKMAVAHSIFNRVDDNRWPDTLHDVCVQPWQFSCWNPNDPNRTKLLQADFTRPSARNALVAVSLVTAGYVEDFTEGANHYMTRALYDSDNRPAWANDMEVTAVIGRHVFLKG